MLAEKVGFYTQASQFQPSPGFIKCFLDYARSHGINQITLQMDSFDPIPLCLYTSMGFNLVATTAFMEIPAPRRRVQKFYYDFRSILTNEGEISF